MDAKDHCIEKLEPIMVSVFKKLQSGAICYCEIAVGIRHDSPNFTLEVDEKTHSQLFNENGVQLATGGYRKKTSLGYSQNDVINIIRKRIHDLFVIKNLKGHHSLFLYVYPKTINAKIQTTEQLIQQKPMRDSIETWSP